MAMWNRCAICGRAIPVGELCYGIKNWHGEPTNGDTICKDCLVPENSPTLTPPNEPLTLEELDGWNTKPAYLVPLGDPIWAAQWSIMRYGRFSVETNAGPTMSICLSKSEYGKTWLAYRSPPEGADA